MFRSRYSTAPSSSWGYKYEDHNNSNDSLHQGPFTVGNAGSRPAYTASMEFFTDTEYGKSQDNDCDNYKRLVLRHDGNTVSFSTPNGGLHRRFFDYRFPQVYWKADATSGDYNRYTPVQTGFGGDGLRGLPKLSTVPDADWDFNPGALTSCSVLESFVPDMYIDDSLIAMMPYIRNKLSILNSIYEFKDFKKLPGTIRRVRAFYSSFTKMANFGSLNRRWTLRRLTKLGSEAYLTDQFAIRPLLREVSILHGLLRSVQQEVKKLLDREGKIQFAYYKASLDSLYPSGSELLDRPFSPASDRMQFLRSVAYLHPPTFRASLKYSFTLSEYQRLHADTLGLFDALGLSLGAVPSILWNALPWSFVVDWFVGVNRWFDRLNKGSLEPSVNIHRYSWSVKMQRVTHIDMRIAPNTQHATGYAPAYTVTETAYRRRAHVPSYDRLLTTSGMSLKELSYTAALAGSRMR